MTTKPACQDKLHTTHYKSYYLMFLDSCQSESLSLSGFLKILLHISHRTYRSYVEKRSISIVDFRQEYICSFLCESNQ